MKDFVKKFRKVDGTLVDVVKHTLNILNEDPTVTISIGTDSQNVKKKTNYVTVIAYRYKNKGVHYIFNKISIPKERDLFRRLFREAEISINTAEWFTQQISVKVDIDLDYNSSEKYESHVVISSAKGWANSLGYKVLLKGEGQIAGWAADYHVR